MGENGTMSVASRIYIKAKNASLLCGGIAFWFSAAALLFAATAIGAKIIEYMNDDSQIRKLNK